jgi:uridylate kinase
MIYPISARVPIDSPHDSQSLSLGFTRKERRALFSLFSLFFLSVGRSAQFTDDDDDDDFSTTTMTTTIPMQTSTSTSTARRRRPVDSNASSVVRRRRPPRILARAAAGRRRDDDDDGSRATWMSASRTVDARSTRTSPRRAMTRAVVDSSSSEEDFETRKRRDAEDGYERWRWRRVMLKVSGEALAGEDGFGISPRVVKAIAGEIAEAALSGVEVAVVVGGGNFFRGAEKEGNGLDRASADYTGMLATVMNALNLQAAIESRGVPTRVMSALEIKEVAEPYIRRRAIRHLEKGRVVIFGAGTGNPFFTTDTGAALRAAEINAQAVLKATKVDGVFDSDPAKNADAKLYETLTYETVRRLGLGVMDQTAITLCEENDIPVVVFNIGRDGNIVDALRGRNVGTRVGSSDARA